VRRSRSRGRVDQRRRRPHELGWAHSVETRESSTGELVGGLYGVHIGGLFAGESMFHRSRDASKVALVALVDHLRTIGVVLLDVQWLTPHLATLGAVEIARPVYLSRLAEALARPTVPFSPRGSS
jgi:leucyl/phenylalanyl-tRNA--protein transferase